MGKYLVFTILIGLSLTSCYGNKNSSAATETDTIAKPQIIQNTILGVTLGKTSLQEAENICLKNGWKYVVQDGFGETAIDVTSPVTFGGVQWPFVEFCFLRGISAYTTFSMDCNDKKASKSDVEEVYSTILKGLIDKYPTHKKDKGHFEAQDSTYNVSLTKDSVPTFGIMLMYAIRNDRLKKIIPSDL